jgi:hypothetical protein
MQFPICRILACRWLDDIRDVECLTESMTHTHNFVIAGVQDNEGSINYDGLRPSLTKSTKLAILYICHNVAVHLLHQTLGSQVIPVFASVIVIVIAVVIVIFVAVVVTIVLAVAPLAFSCLWCSSGPRRCLSLFVPDGRCLVLPFLRDARCSCWDLFVCTRRGRCGGMRSSSFLPDPISTPLR